MPMDLHSQVLLCPQPQLPLAHNGGLQYDTRDTLSSSSNPASPPKESMFTKKHREQSCQYQQTESMTKREMRAWQTHGPRTNSFKIFSHPFSPNIPLGCLPFPHSVPHPAVPSFFSLPNPFSPPEHFTFLYRAVVLAHNTQDQTHPDLVRSGFLYSINSNEHSCNHV